jgi:hypothetical protein
MLHRRTAPAITRLLRSKWPETTGATKRHRSGPKNALYLHSQNLLTELLRVALLRKQVHTHTHTKDTLAVR